MIDRPYIARWREFAPWNNLAQVEQDLIISRTLIELFEDEFLSQNLAFRGGTALYKLFLFPAPRYSEDIDLVQIKPGPIKPVMTRINEIVDFFEEKRQTKQKENNNTIYYRFTSEYPPQIRMRLKIEINCREHFNASGLRKAPFGMTNPWFKGKTEITTYSLEELLGTKLRALYQRKKGRDLFDLYYAWQKKGFEPASVIRVYERYMEFSVGKVPTMKQYLLNMKEKMDDQAFVGDLEGLLRPEIKFDFNDAFEWIFEKIIPLMR